VGLAAIWRLRFEPGAMLARLLSGCMIPICQIPFGYFIGRGVVRLNIGGLTAE
jgi:hypothetical protein